MISKVVAAAGTPIECVDAWNFEQKSAVVKVFAVTESDNNLVVRLATSSMSSLAADWINDFAKGLAQVQADEHVDGLELSYAKSDCSVSAINPFLIACGSSNPTSLKFTVKNNSTGQLYDKTVSQAYVNLETETIESESIYGKTVNSAVQIRAYLDGKPSEIDRRFSPNLCSPAIKQIDRAQAKSGQQKER